MDAASDIAEGIDPPPRFRSRRLRRALLVLVLLVVGVLGGIWLARERLADRLIADALSGYGLPASYRIESIGPKRQILADVVIGDPRSPDLTLERIEVVIAYRLGLPRIGTVRLVRPRLYGSLRDGQLSFGALDPLLFTGSDEPFRLPDVALTLTDARGLLRSDYGDIGLRIEGSGPLRDGFSGRLGAVAHDLVVAGCTGTGGSLYGTLKVADERPRFTGPLRLDTLSCPDEMRLANATLAIDVRFDPQLDGVDATARLRSGRVALAGSSASRLSGTIDASWRAKALTARFDLTGADLEAGGVRVADVELEGTLRARGAFDRMELRGGVAGTTLQPGIAFDRQLAGWIAATRGTLGAPLLARARSALQREGWGSSFSAEFQARMNDSQLALVVPQARLRGASGETLLSLSRLQYAGAGSRMPRLSGNFATGGAGLPRVVGRMETAGDGQMQLRVTMAQYKAGDARIAVPDLLVRQAPSGAIGFSGHVLASGALPGGFVDSVDLQVRGDWSAGRGLTVWRDCTTLRFARLRYGNLTLDQRRLTLCPPPGEAIVRSTAKGMRVAAGIPRVDLTGKLGGTTIRVAGGPIGLAMPGTLSARSLTIELGPRGSETRFKLAALTARVGGNLAGSFTDAELRLAAVPLDITNAAGKWDYTGGRLTIAGASLQVTDRQPDARFQPMISKDAALLLVDNRITVHALLREARTERAIVKVAIAHDLETARGHADLGVPGIRFDRGLQPDSVSRLALGVVANTQGVVTGSGRIDWDAEGITSTGRLHSDSLDFAAAFGPVKGLSGTLLFTDLLGLVTASGQELRVAEINPGVPVENGVILISLDPGLILDVEGARWPFLGGTLMLLPTRLSMSEPEVRRFTLRIEGLDAARFVERMDLGNLTATGTLDGEMPLIFDQDGGRIEGGRLLSRLPGGNISYLGALTYEDMSPIANFAFDALKSIDYRQLRVLMDGELDGELVTRVRFDGVTQGTGAKRNFIISSLAALPIRFNINIRAPFYQLISSVKSFYDPSALRDPRALGLIDDAGVPLRDGPVSAPPDDQPAIPGETAAGTDIQPSASEPAL